MDPAEHASDTAQFHLEHRLDNRERYQGESATHCADCADPIPQRRRESIAGCRRCCSCQEDHDRRNNP
jgi:RNA polymerase-binding transcription factor DksA